MFNFSNEISCDKRDFTFIMPEYFEVNRKYGNIFHLMKVKLLSISIIKKLNVLNLQKLNLKVKKIITRRTNNIKYYRRRPGVPSPI